MFSTMRNRGGAWYVVSPCEAGVDRRDGRSPLSPDRFPRKCGGGSLYYPEIWIEKEVSPRERGWVGLKDFSDQGRVLPARAGVSRKAATEANAAPPSSPRARGGESVL